MRTYTAHFTIRYYECDAYGHLNNANYLRLMEQAAIEASADAGYDDARYRALGTAWWIYETDIEYRLPLRAGDAVEVKTWVADFRRVRSQRVYEFRRVGDDTVCARAITDWVYLDRETQRPISVPPAMIAAFAPDGAPDPAPRAPIPQAPPPPARPFTLQRTVEWRDIDMVRHVNNATYLSYMEACAIQSLGAFGWSVDRLEAERVAIVARRHQIVYQRPALLGDELLITTYLAELRRVSAVRHFSIERASDGAALARAYTRWAFVDPQTGHPSRVPEAILADFADHVAR